MYNRRYEKVFLVLRQETAGYALGKRPPWGSCVMELKNGRGRLQFTIQGLKAGCYEVYVMAGQESIFCGSVYPTGSEGRCELKWEFDPEYLGAGKKAEELHTVLIMAEGLAAPLTAYFKEKRNWKADFRRYEGAQAEILLQAAETAMVMEPSVMVQKKAVDENKCREDRKTVERKEIKEENERKEKNINAEIAEVQKGSYHGSFQGLLAKFRQELEELEEAGVLSPAETKELKAGGQQEGNMGKTEQGLFVGNRELFPFGDGKPWKCLSPDELSLLAEIPLRWRQEFFFLLPGRRYHHLILQEQEEGVFLGLPDYYREEDAQEGKRFGFHEFRSVDGEWGYWLCFLERKK